MVFDAVERLGDPDPGVVLPEGLRLARRVGEASPRLARKRLSLDGSCFQGLPESVF